MFRFDTLQWSQPLCGACDAALATQRLLQPCCLTQ